MARKNRNPYADWLQAALIRFYLVCTLPLGFRARSALSGWLMQKVVQNVPRLRDRVDQNLDLVMPDLPPQDRAAIRAGMADTFGRSMVEILTPKGLLARRESITVSGVGLDILSQCHQQGRGAILIGAHFGQWDAIRVGLLARGMQVSGVYRVNDNPHYDAMFVRAIETLGGPCFPNSRNGTRAIFRHVAKGGFVAFLNDQALRSSPVLSFFNRPARTATFAAELSLKLDVPILAAYGIRHDPHGYEVIIEAPVPPSDPLAMTQSLNDSLEARVRENPEQWYWLHRRWK